MAEPVILITADDDHLLLREYETVLAEVRGDHPDAEVAVHLAAELDHLPDLRTSSLFGGRTVVVIRGVEAVREALKGQLEDYLASPDPEAVLILVARGTGKVRKIATLAADAGRVVEAGVPKPWDERGWRDLIGREFRRLQRRADASAVEAILDRAGTSAATIASHISQVCLAKPDVDTLTDVEVAEVIEGAGNQGGLAIADAALQDRDPARTVVLVRGALDAGEAPLGVLGAVTAKVRDLMVARAGLDVAEGRRRPDRSAAKPRVHPFQLKQLEQAATRFEVGELQWCHDRIARADLALKGDSELPSDVVLELALLDVATRRQPGAPWDPRA